MAFNFNWKPQDLSYQQYQFLSNPDEAFKNRTNTKQAQEMLGFEGKGIDGVAGKATRDAYNKQMRYYNDLYGNVSKAGSLDLNDPNAFYNDIHDAETYGFTPQEAENELNADILAEKQQQEAAAKEQKIASLESQIASLQKRIDDNTAKLKGFGTNADKIAAIEARKINSADPTSIWRWKVDRDEARRIANDQNKPNDTARANALIDANNTLDSMIIDENLDTPTKNAMLSKLADVKSSLEKNGFDTTRVNSMISKLKGNGPQTPREQAKTTWHGLQGKKDLTSAELDAAINDPNMKWDPNDLEDAKNLSDKLKKHEAATQSVKDMKADYKRRTGKDFDQADPYIQMKEQERWKRRNKK